jgi:hypothetical protein
MTYDFDLHLDWHDPIPPLTDKDKYYLTCEQIKQRESLYSIYQLYITRRYDKAKLYGRMVPDRKDLEYYRMLCTDVNFALLNITTCMRGSKLHGRGADYIGSLICKSTMRLPLKIDFNERYLDYDTHPSWLRCIGYKDKIKFILKDHI